MDAIVKYISSFIIYKVEVSALGHFLGALGPLAVGSKAALGVGDKGAAEEVGDDIENPHADHAIGGGMSWPLPLQNREPITRSTPLSRGWRSCGISSGSRCAPSGTQLELTF